MTSNLPQNTSVDTTENVKQFFDRYFKTPITFPSNEIDAVVGFFQRRGFDVDSARSTAITLLTQAKNDGVNVFQLLDTMKSLTDVQLSQLVAQVLNSTREKTSLLGYRVAPVANPYESRNILV